ncbi:SMC-Scp complex subunit ScpB [Rickettsiella grylli]|uniref:Segregation and condensation protein B n=1 Tax=Rickettsiella grylli TaxID=59196 RepID=A8PMT2_9COXI|nr:SMC-Scp complex subunit ScpB [Rickettsiella grylli]EDP46072.1 segregation and condensation protein B [Rickettsiella grylli]
MEIQKLKFVCEAALFAAGEPVSLKRLLDLFTDEERPTASEMKKILADLTHDYRDRGIHLKQLASGYCFQTDSLLHDWVKRLWPEKPPRYSRAFLETLSIIAYKQPVTRGDIEAIRGVAVSPQIIKVLLEHAWIQVVGQREVPGRPNLYATSTLFLDHFGLKTVSELPPFPSKTNEVTPCPRVDYHNTI